MIRFLVDGAENGYVLVAESEQEFVPVIRSLVLKDERAIAAQARELADAAAALLESLPECEGAFNLLHDVLDELPSE